MRRTLAAHGLVEAVTWSFIDRHDAALFGAADGLESTIRFPRNCRHAPFAAAGLLAASARNVARGFA